MAKEPEPQNPKIRTNSNDHLNLTPREKQPGGTMRSPGRYALRTATHKALMAVAQMRGTPVSKVENVRAANVEGDMRVWLYTTHDQDPDRIEVTHYRNRLNVNLSQVLTNWNLALPTGQRRVYDLQIDPNSPVGPALVLHMDKPLETRWDPAPKKGETTRKTETQPKAETQKTETPKTETQKTETPKTEIQKTETRSEAQKTETQSENPGQQAAPGTQPEAPKSEPTPEN